MGDLSYAHVILHIYKLLPIQLLPTLSVSSVQTQTYRSIRNPLFTFLTMS